jgi:hypothetical protein
VNYNDGAESQRALGVLECLDIWEGTCRPVCRWMMLRHFLAKFHCQSLPKRCNRSLFSSPAADRIINCRNDLGRFLLPPATVELEVGEDFGRRPVCTICRVFVESVSVYVLCITCSRARCIAVAAISKEEKSLETSQIG